MWGLVSAIFCMGLVLVMQQAAPFSAPRDMSAQLDRIARQVEQAQNVPAATREKLARLLVESAYDCRNIKCDAKEDARNLAARSRLASAIERNGASMEFSSQRNEREVVATGSVR